MKELPAGKLPGAGRGQGGKGRPFQKGFDPRRNKEGPGRPTNIDYARFAALATRTIPEEILADIKPETREKLLHDHPMVWLAVMKLRADTWRDCADRAWGRARQAIEVSDAFERVFEITQTLTPEEWRRRYAKPN